MPGNTHDPTFKHLFGDPEHAAALVRHCLPGRIVARLDLGTLTREPASFVDDQLSERYSDLLFSVTTIHGHAFVYLLIEHQSSNDPDLPLRMLVRVGSTRCSSATPTSPPSSRASSCRSRTSSRSPTTRSGRGRWAPASSSLWMLRDSRTAQRFRDSLPAWKAQFEDAASSATGLELLAVLFRYIIKVNDELELTEIHAKIHELSPAAGSAMMTIAEKLIQQGLTQGLTQGRTEGLTQGRTEGRIELLMRQLAVKFGELAEHYRERLTQATLAELDTWAERVLGAKTLDDMFTD